MTHAMGHKGPRITIQVTQDIIDFAERGNSSHCAAAMAIEQQCPWANRVCVDIQTIRFTDTRTGLRVVYLTPRIVQEGIVDFDDGVHIKPFSFRLQGAMVTAVRGRLDRTQEAREREKESNRKNYRRKRIVQGGRNAKHRLAPTVVGGRTPPRAGTRREFGLRAFQRDKQASK